jgi:nucleotide-binding universal stress UspA family protein
MLTIRTILHPTDFSESSRQAFEMACSLARDHGAKLIVLYVQAPPVIVFGEGMVPPEPVSYVNELREQLRHMQPTEPQIEMERRMLEGDAATEILKVAKETKADLIVMGTHGRSALGRFLMGSVATHVVRRATCPVVTVKAAPVSKPITTKATSEHLQEAVAVGES